MTYPVLLMGYIVVGDFFSGGTYNILKAEVAELADALGSGSSGRKAVRVQLPPSAPKGGNDAQDYEEGESCKKGSCQESKSCEEEGC